MAFKAIKNKIKSLFTRFPKDVKYPIKEAFTIEGRTFYQFEDTFNIPYQRGLKVVTFFEEARMKITYEYLELEAKAMDKILTSQKIDVFKIKALNDIKKERLKWYCDTDIMYRCASAIFFEKGDNYTTYDFKKGAENIEFWKKHKSVSDFFYQVPLLQYFPFLTELEVNLENYSEITKALTKQHSDLVTSILSEK